MTMTIVRDHQRPVHLRHVDLADLVRRGMVDVRRGQYPSCTAWRVSEKAPEMSACDAMIAAAVASTTMRKERPDRGRAGRTAARAAVASMSSSAPWPK